MALKGELKTNGNATFSDFALYYTFNGAYIEGIKKLFSIAEEEIAFTVKGGVVTIKGNNLNLTDSGKGYAAVSGNITSIERS